jgi:23S rRNA (guanosine2251-2'-O)-methyltransferase
MNEKVKMDELNRLSIDEFKTTKKNPVIIILDNVRSLHNVGSVFRTADAFLVEEIFLCGYTGTPPNKEIEKTALGATSSVNWNYFKTTEEALAQVKKNEYIVYSIEQTKKSISLNDFVLENKKLALVFGNEVYGVEQNIIGLSEGVIEIPQAGSKHSLNIAVSVGVVLWEILKHKL